MKRGQKRLRAIWNPGSDFVSSVNCEICALGRRAEFHSRFLFVNHFFVGSWYYWSIAPITRRMHAFFCAWVFVNCILQWFVYERWDKKKRSIDVYGDGVNFLWKEDIKNGHLRDVSMRKKPYYFKDLSYGKIVLNFFAIEMYTPIFLYTINKRV